jgi:DNA-binding NarL/FixJ family response regulator
MTKAGQIRVLIADDHTMVRQALRNALQAYPNIEVVGEAGDEDEAVIATAKLQPKVVVMDVNMARMDGITATRLIKAQHQEVKVIGLSVDLKDYQFHALKNAGASMVLSKENAALYELYGAIQQAVA